MTEESAAPVDENMPPEVIPAAELETPPESAPAVENEDPGIDTAASEEKVYTEEQAKELAQGRINKVIADRGGETRRADKAEARIKELEGEPPAEVPEPKLEDFDFDEGKYNAALIKHEVQKATRETVGNYKTEQDGIAATNRQNEINIKFDERAVEFRKEKPDYDQVIDALPLIPGDVMDEIMQHDNGPKLAHYLGTHLDQAETITLMKLGEISAQLAIVKPTKQPSAAPDPIEPVTSGGTLNKSMEDMDMEDIMALPSTRRGQQERSGHGVNHGY